MQIGLARVQGHYRWLEASLHLDLTRHYQAAGDGPLAKKHRQACLTMSGEHGFKLLRTEAEMLGPTTSY
jgi:hypothetical protein